MTLPIYVLICGALGFFLGGFYIGFLMCAVFSVDRVIRRTHNRRPRFNNPDPYYVRPAIVTGRPAVTKRERALSAAFIAAAAIAVGALYLTL